MLKMLHATPCTLPLFRSDDRLLTKTGSYFCPSCTVWPSRMFPDQWHPSAQMELQSLFGKSFAATQKNVYLFVCFFFHDIKKQVKKHGVFWRYGIFIRHPLTNAPRRFIHTKDVTPEGVSKMFCTKLPRPTPQAVDSEEASLPRIAQWGPGGGLLGSLSLILAGMGCQSS